MIPNEVFLMNIEKAATLLETTNVKQHFGSYEGRDGSVCAYALLNKNKIQLPDITMGLIVIQNDFHFKTFKQIARWLRNTPRQELIMPLPLQPNATPLLRS